MILFLIKINTAHTWDMALAQPSVVICVLHHLLLPVRKQSFLFPKTLIKPSPPIVCSEDFPNPEYSYSIGLLVYPLPLLPCISSCCFRPTLPIQLCHNHLCCTKPDSTPPPALPALLAFSILPSPFQFFWVLTGSQFCWGPPSLLPSNT